MKRMVYLCKLAGDGTRGNEYRPACDGYNCAWRAYTWSELTGKPRHAWTLAIVDAVDHAPIQADANCNAFDIAFSTLYADLPQPVKKKLSDFLDANLVPKTFLSGVVTVMDVWMHLGKLLDANFSSAMLGNEVSA